jgi:protein AATF/BFR2
MREVESTTPKMTKSKGRATQFADIDVRVSRGSLNLHFPRSSRRDPFLLSPFFILDFDPEDDAPAQHPNNGSDDSTEHSDSNDMEHYVEVGYVYFCHEAPSSNISCRKSRLRQAEVGPRYAGSLISRENLLHVDDGSGSESDNYEEIDAEADARAEFADPEEVDLSTDEEDGDIDSDAAFGHSDVEKFAGFTFRGSSKPTVNDGRQRPTAADFMSDSENEDDVFDLEPTKETGTSEKSNLVEEHVAEVEESGGGSEETRDDSTGTGSDMEEKGLDDQSAKSVERSESGSENGDDEKARRAELREIMNEEQTTVVTAISQAAKVDAEKGNAIRQQRKTFDSLLNVRITIQKALIATNSMAAIEVDDADSDAVMPYQAAEDAAIKLWNTLDRVRYDLLKANNTTKIGQKRKRDVDSSTTSSIIWQRMQSSEVASIDNRQITLEKWWSKVKGSTPATGRLIKAAPAQAITFAIQDHLAKPGPLENTKKPRSCAPVQEKLKLAEDANIYDDTGFYKLLLNQLVEQRKMDIGPLVEGGTEATAQWAVKEAKMRKKVDTKASKGRKMRFTVHEKLQNFMAPESRGSWEQEAIGRFFGSLLGQKMTLREDDTDVDHENGDLSEEGGLKLFRS